MLPRILTSYFYQIRFMQPWHIPLSTALGDPKWYHNFQGKDFLFLDKRGVVNGARLEAFMPGPRCSYLCYGRDGCNYSPESCDFLRIYREQLNNLDFNKVKAIMEETAVAIKRSFTLDRDPVFILMVHEAITNPCSERHPIQEWFTSHGVEVREFDPTIDC